MPTRSSWKRQLGRSALLGFAVGMATWSPSSAPLPTPPPVSLPVRVGPPAITERVAPDSLPEIGSSAAHRESGVIELRAPFSDPGDPNPPYGHMAIHSEYANPGRHRTTFCVATDKRRSVEVTVIYHPDASASQSVTRDLTVDTGPESTCRVVDYEGAPLGSMSLNPSYATRYWQQPFTPWDDYQPERGAAARGPAVNVVPQLKSQLAKTRARR